jgi:hypothetical protein
MTELKGPASAPHPVGAPAAGQSSPEQVVTDFFDAFDRHDVEAVRRLLTDGVVEELRMLAVEGMGHDLHRFAWPEVIENIAAVAERGEPHPV